MSQINQPVVALPQLTGNQPDAMVVWVANNMLQAYPQCTVQWTISHDGKKLLDGSQQIDVLPLEAIKGQKIDLKAITAKADVIEIQLLLKDSEDNLISRYYRQLQCLPNELVKKR